jgi:hypothetical protein
MMEEGRGDSPAWRHSGDPDSFGGCSPRGAANPFPADILMRVAVIPFEAGGTPLEAREPRDGTVVYTDYNWNRRSDLEREFVS